MLSFSKAMTDVVLKHEGSKLTTDNNGAWVKYGINQKANPDIDVQNLSWAKACEIYLTRYWNPLKLSDPRYTNESLGFSIFDFAINAGVTPAAQALQKAISTLGRKISIDGKIGEGTLNALASSSQANVLKEFSKNRIIHYKNVVAKRPSDSKYLPIWLDRVYEYIPKNILESSANLFPLVILGITGWLLYKGYKNG